jgi:hypothetical protein
LRNEQQSITTALNFEGRGLAHLYFLSVASHKALPDRDGRKEGKSLSVHVWEGLKMFPRYKEGSQK